MEPTTECGGLPCLKRKQQERGPHAAAAEAKDDHGTRRELPRVAVEIGMAMGNSVAVMSPSIRIYIDTNRCDSARSAIASACSSNSKQQRRRLLQRVHAAC